MSLDFYDVRHADLSDGFGATAGRSQPHRGLDFVHGPGKPVPAVSAGVVAVSAFHQGLGWVVEVEGRDGVYVGYCHLLEQGLGVGERVNVGSTVGYVGSTGTQSTGPHLHITKGDRRGAVFGATMAWLSDPWPYIQAAKSIGALSVEEEDDDMPDSMYAVVDGVPSWCILNWSTGRLYAVHSQAEADWIGAYMGSVRTDLSRAVYNGQPVTDGGSSLYKSKLALFGALALAPKIINESVLSEADLKRIRDMLEAGLAGLGLKAGA